MPMDRYKDNVKPSDILPDHFYSSAQLSSQVTNYQIKNLGLAIRLPSFCPKSSLVTRLSIGCNLFNFGFYFFRNLRETSSTWV